MRGVVFAFAVVCGLGAAAWSLACGKSCTLIGCVPHTSLDVLVPIPIASAARMNVEVCRETECVTGRGEQQQPKPRTGIDVKATSARGLVFQGGEWVEVDGASRLSLDFAFPDAPPRDGDRYSVKLTSPDASAPVLAFDRRALYERNYPNGEECDRTACLAAHLRVRGGARAGLTCGTTRCDSGCRITGRLGAGELLDLRACRNGKCAQAEIEVFRGRLGHVQPTNTTPEIDYGVQRESDEGPGSVNVVIWGEPASLTDGDTYSLTVVDAKSGTTAFHVERAVKYESTFPNGPECDGDPCKRATIAVP